MQEVLDSVCKRAETYKLLSDCYYLPGSDLIKKVLAKAQANEMFAELATQITDDCDIESLTIDFSRLFVGPFKLLAAPYGSVYLENNRMMGDSTIDVRNIYKDEDLNVVIKDAPDHIAMELEFMYYLALKQFEAIEAENCQDTQEYQQKQYAFLGTHLSRWVPAFVKEVQQHADTEFYKKLGKLTGAFVQDDLDTLASLCS